MTRTAWLGALLLAVSAGAGCVERRYLITSDPPGALVYRNGVPIGATPVDDYFIYYGEYDFTLVKEGYETLHARVKIGTPWYEVPPLDFVTENLYPFKVRDVREGGPFHFVLRPWSMPNPGEVLNRANDLRDRGRTLGPEDAFGPAPPRTPAGPVAPIGTVVPPAAPAPAAPMPPAP
jgi:hypothetical protein